MYSWARFRVADLAVTLYWLHDRTDEPWLVGPGQEGVCPEPRLARPVRGLQVHHQDPGRSSSSTHHGVNTGMALKYGGVRYRLTGDANDKDAVFRMLDLLDRYHGQATGIFTCDEHLAGRSPSQGTELCTVVEAMYSLEVLAAHSGRFPAGRPPGEARVQRPAGDLQERHDGPPVRPAVQPGDLLGRRASTSTSTTGRIRTSTASSRTSAAARPTCIKAGPSSPPTSG